MNFKKFCPTVTKSIKTNLTPEEIVGKLSEVVGGQKTYGGMLNRSGFNLRKASDRYEDSRPMFLKGEIIQENSGSLLIISAGHDFMEVNIAMIAAIGVALYWAIRKEFFTALFTFSGIPVVYLLVFEYIKYKARKRINFILQAIFKNEK